MSADGQVRGAGPGAARPFDVWCVSPAGGAHPGIAVAAARAGGIGLLDLEFATPAAARAAFERACRATDGRLALRASASQADLVAELLAARRCDVIVSWSPGYAAVAARLRPLADRLLLEVTSVEQLESLAAGLDGIVGRGHEAGGWVGEDSTYILAQKLLAASSLPVVMQGGIGLHGAAACRVAGAAGVVLDDVCLLLRESPLSETQQSELARLNGSETRLFGELLEAPCRVYARPSDPVLKQAEAEHRAAESSVATDWRESFAARVGWNEGQLMPVGQGIGLAVSCREKHRTVGRLVQAVRRASGELIEQAAKADPLAPGAPLAQALGTRYPLLQGPMTRVSDVAGFAHAVSANGGLPFLALALMRGPQVREMLRETKEKLGKLPWGVGMLGFVPQALRQEQCEAIWEFQPPYALIAGGRPDQAAEFEQRGIPTYIHAPAPALLKMYLEQGARRFVFEGRECGGHIGPLTSFALWEQMIEVLLAHVPAGAESEVHAIFAGGLSDARSCAMLSAMTAPLAARGIKVGGLMGTAYLFTQEIVDSGAVVPGFQEQALACSRTKSLETGPGHSTRCADTPFAREFFEARRALLASGKGADEIRDELEDLNLGRLRIASKGLERDAKGAIVEVGAKRQYDDGMFMIGQVATLQERVRTVAQLHEDVSAGGSILLGQWQAQRAERRASAQPSDIAIVGIGTLVPQASDPDTFWENVLHQVNVIREIPKSRWDWELYFDADRNARDKVYSKWGGFLDEIPFDPTKLGIPPRSMKSIDPMQLLCLEATVRALSDAGYGDGNFDRAGTSVIFGAGGGVGDLGMQFGVRSELPRFVDAPSDGVWDRLPEWTNETFAGVLQNVAAGRIANRLDFGGVNYTVDAACASSLAAVSLAVQELESGRSNMVVAGGVDTVQGPFGFLCFSKTQALSPTGKARTFDKSADGIAISEGSAVVVLKRLADAERDGDRIYAVIKAVAGSSDGKALGMTAPRPEGQMLALQRAYEKAGFPASTLQLVEAHGTGTPVGDRAEAETITRSLRAQGVAPRSVAIGSIKTHLGHTKAAAGIVGLIKMALSLHHRVLPGQANVSDPIEPIADPQAPVYLLKDSRPWLRNAHGPRRAGVSAFGFGGTNFHAVLEEYRGAVNREDAPGAKHWPHELCVFRAPSVEALRGQIAERIQALAAGDRVRLADLAFSLAREADARRAEPVAVAIVAASIKALAADLATVVAHLDTNKPLPPHIRLARQLPASAPKLGLLFPGQGAQYVGMGCEAALYLSELREAFEQADEALPDLQLSRMAWPPSAYDADAEAAQQRALTDTRVAQPAIGTLSLGFLRLAERLGIEPAAAAGHSYGEYAALCAAGVITPGQLLELSAIRGRAMADAAAQSQPGGMAAVQAPRARVAEAIAAFRGVKIANHNSPEQVVISGPAEQVDHAAAALQSHNMRATRLPVSGAFHTELVAAAQAPLGAALKAAQFSAPRFPVYSNTTGAAHAADPAAIRATLDTHLLSPVEFVAEIEAMYRDGVRVFLELGPRSICSNMAAATLAGRDARTVAIDGQGGGLKGLLTGLADLVTCGVRLDLARLFDGRGLASFPLARLATLNQPVALPRTTWFISGGCARPSEDPVQRNGKEVPLDRSAADLARQRREAAPQPAPAAIAPAAPSMSGAPIPGEAFEAYQQTMRQFLALQERVMAQFLGGTAAPATLPQMPAWTPALPAPEPIAAPAPQPAPVPAQRTAPAPAASDRATLQKLLVGIVSERSGYPEDMLSLDADLEADLGIDSIKRVEILGSFQKALPASASSAMQGRMERYTRAKTLNAILDHATADAGAFAPAATTATPETAAPATAIDLKAVLVGIVAERTGYPQDMLGLDADLEADLGVDSIKRVEILGAFQKQLPGTVSVKMQSGMERFTRAKTLSAILQQAQALFAGAAPSPAAAPAPVATETADRADPQRWLLEIVAERTGYPQEMLGLDADLEADLGIDSIKRVEILGAFQKKLPAALGAAMQGSMERFTRAKTLNAILQQATQASTASTPATAPVIAPEAIAPAAPAAAAPRFVVRPRAAPLGAERAPLHGLIVVAGAPPQIGAALTPRIEGPGVTVVAIDEHEPQALAEAIAAARKAHGPVKAWLHLHALDAAEPASLSDWQALRQRYLLSLFHALRAMPDDLGTLRLLTTSRTGGTLGREAGGRGAPIGAAVNGLLNCFRHEYPDALARHVDFNGQTPGEIAGLLVQELFAADSAPEVGYATGVRYGSATVREALPDAAVALEPSSEWVLLATGGARGVTADTVEALVRPGMRVVLLGRSAEPAAEPADLAAAADAGSVRKLLLAQARERGETPRPVQLDQQLSRVLADREIRGNLARLRKAGAQLEYVACDVRDAEAFGRTIDAVYERHGRIDAVLHGAGVIEDKLLLDKSPESFERVFSTKVDSAVVLAGKLRPESLKALVFFASVAGRYGNKGQSDYAAANETLNRIAWDLSRRWPETRVVAVNWGPWDAGMASEGVKRQFRERGIEPIPVAAGARFLVEELRRGGHGDVELVAGQGPWASAVETPDAAPSEGQPLIRGPVRVGPGGHVTVTQVLSLAADPWLADHRIDGKPVLPAAAAAEWMAQFAASAWPGFQVSEIRDLRVLSGIVLDEGSSRELQLRARNSTHSGAGEQNVTVEILDPGRRAPCYRATVMLVERLPEPPTLPSDTLAGGAMDAPKMYREHLFHGTLFQRVTALTALDSAGVDARLEASSPKAWLDRPEPWLFDPAVIDCGPQLAIVWARKQRGMTALPSAFGSIRRFGEGPLLGALSMALRMKPAPHEHGVQYDVTVRDAAGHVRLVMEDCQGTLSAALNRLAQGS